MPPIPATSAALAQTANHDGRKVSSPKALSSQKHNTY